MAVAACALAIGIKAQAQDYVYGNFDVTVHQAPSANDWIATVQMLRQQTQEIEQQNIRRFYNGWVYEFTNGQKRFYMNAVPGLGAALAHNDWGAAWSFASDWISKEMAYEKRYHQASPAYVAAYKATYMQQRGKFKK